MSGIWTEVAIIFALLAINGVFAMTEIAVVSARKARLRQLAEEGNLGAKAALRLAESPNRFLGTVQIGITLVGILAGAFGGATIAEVIAEAMQAWPALAPYGESIGLGIVVLAITYFSLVFGELVPKRIGLGNPERIAMLVARPMHLLSVVSAPVVKLLSLSTETVLRVLPFPPDEEAAVTEEEIKALMQEGLRSGAFNHVESEIVQSALELDQWSVRDIMTPRIQIIWLNKDEPHEAVWHKIVASGHSFFPVYEGTRDNVVGTVSVKAIYAHLSADLPVRIADLMIEPLFVPATQSVLQLLDTYRKTHRHMALVADEFGGIDGVVTLNDVMQAILGEFVPLEERQKPQARKRDDGTWLVDGTVLLERIKEIIRVPQSAIDGEGHYQTLAGFVVKRMGHIPKEGQQFEFEGWQFEVIDMDRHRVDKVLLRPILDANKDNDA